MPLIDCGACGRKISSDASSCPQCGHPNRPNLPASSGYKLQWQHLFFAVEVAEADIDRAFAADLSQNGWISLTGPDGNLLFTMILAGELYSLQHNDARTKDRVWAQGQYPKDEVREAFRQFRRGDPRWRTSREWGKNPILTPAAKPNAGCFAAILLLLGMCAAFAAVAA